MIKSIEINKLRDRYAYKGHLKQLHENGDPIDDKYKIALTANGETLLTLSCARSLRIGNNYYWMPQDDTAYEQYKNYLLHNVCPTADDLFIWRKDTIGLHRAHGQSGDYKNTIDGLTIKKHRAALNPKSENFNSEALHVLRNMEDKPEWSSVFLTGTKLRRAYGLRKKINEDKFVPFMFMHEYIFCPRCD